MPPWLLVVLFGPLCLAQPIGAVFGTRATAGYVVFCVIATIVMLSALPKTDASEPETEALWRWTVPVLVVLWLVSSAAAWWLRADGF